MLGFIAQSQKYFNLPLQQTAHGRWQSRRWTNNRSMRPVGSTESIIDVHVNVMNQRINKIFTVGFLSCIETKILQQFNTRRQLS